MLQMTRSEYDLVIMTQIKATTSMGGQTVGNKRKAHERQRDTYNYMHEGQKVVLYHLNMNLIVYWVCKNTFLKINACGKRKFEIMKHMKTNGLVTRYELNIHFNVLFIANNRIHGNTGRKPPQALSRDELNRVLSFIKNYAEIHAILLPGRIPGVKDYEKVKLLPCNTSKAALLGVL